MKILVTADVHHSKHVMGKNENCIKFITDTMRTERPSLFVIAGDLNDSQTLRSGSEEMRSLIKFVKETTKVANELGIMYVIIRGTKGHDGDVIQTLHDSISSENGENRFDYIDTPTLMDVEGYKMLMLPEMYVPSISDFEDALDTVLYGNKADVIFFHGMMDFAIVQMKQEDSMYGLSRSVLIDSKKFAERFNICAVGGHFHSQISNMDIIYTDTMINGLYNTSMNLGLGLLDVSKESHSYTFNTIKNPYNIIHKIVNLDFTTSTMEEIESTVNDIREKYNIKDVIFNVITDATPTVLNNYTTFIKVYKPSQVKRRIKDTAAKRIVPAELKKSTQITESEIISLVIDVAKGKYGEKLEQEKVKEFTSTNDDGE